MAPVQSQEDGSLMVATLLPGGDPSVVEVVTSSSSSGLAIPPSSSLCSTWFTNHHLSGDDLWTNQMSANSTGDILARQLSANQSKSLDEMNGTYCDVVWDGFYCWPATLAGTQLSRSCEEIFRQSPDFPRDRLSPSEHAYAYRVCDQNATWLDNWTNYTECLQILANNESEMSNGHQNQTIRRLVLLIMFFCSIISIILLLVTLFIFTYFKSLTCCRLRVHRNLVLALLIHSVLLLTMAGPHVFGLAWSSYWEIEWLCKLILTLKLYSTLASINWMFIEGLLLHSRITVSVFRKDAPFKLYHFLGWGFPFLLVLAWALQMSLTLGSVCWTGYAESIYIWIIVGPMVLALLVNCIFLVNIIRVLLTKLRLTVTFEINQIRKAIKATALLFPLLGISHLLFCINPDDDGQLEDAYLLFNAFLQSSQGIFVSVLYCFMDSEVQQVLRNACQRTSLKHRAFRWSRNTTAFRNRSYLASQTSITYAVPSPPLPKHHQINRHLTEDELHSIFKEIRKDSISRPKKSNSVPRGRLEDCRTETGSWNQNKLCIVYSSTGEMVRFKPLNDGKNSRKNSPPK